MKKYFPALFLLVLIISSCIQEELDFDSIKSQNWNAEWAIPLIKSNLTILDILDDSTNQIIEDEDGLIALIYESDELVSTTAEEIIEIPDQVNEQEKAFDLPVIPPGISGELPVQFTFVFNLDQEGLKIDSLIFKEGFYEVSITTDLNKDSIEVDCHIPNLIDRQTGESLLFTLDFNNPEGDIITRDTMLNMNLYEVIFENAVADTNEIYINLLVRFKGDDNVLLNPYMINLTNTFSGLQFSRFFGYGGLREFMMEDTIDIDLFDVNQEGYFSFSEGSTVLNIEAENSFGVPINLDVTTFRAYNSGDNQDSADIYIFGVGNPSVISLNYPDPDKIGESEYTYVSSNQSNLYEVLDISPDRLYVQATGILNPGEDPNLMNFLLDSSKIKTSLSLELKLFGSASGFTIRDTVEFDPGSLDDFEYLVFGTNIENEFPIDAHVQVEFADSLDNILFSLIPPGEQLVVAAEAGSAPDYRVTESSGKILEIPVEDYEIDAINQSKKIFISGQLSTNNNEVVKIYSDYELIVRLGAKIGISY